MQIRARIGDHDAVAELDEALALRIDREGRWITLRDGDCFFRRALDSSVVLSRGARRAPEKLSATGDIHERARVAARRIQEVSRRSGVTLALRGADATELRARLAAVDGWTRDRFSREQRLYEGAYPERMEILPPDRYLNLVVMATTGCPYGRCSFCAFYRDRRFRALSSQDLDIHLAAVAQLMREASALRSGIFLGAANALALSQERMLDVLARVQAAFPEVTRDYAAFWDPDHSPERNAKAWAALRAAGLTRVCAGLESGLPALRAELGKSADVDAFVRRVREQRAGGVHAGITVLAGIGGRQQVAAHTGATIEALQAMALTRDDFVYVSPLEGGGVSADNAEQMSDAMIGAFRKELDARIVPYRIRCFCYYA